MATPVYSFMESAGCSPWPCTTAWGIRFLLSTGGMRIPAICGPGWSISSALPLVGGYVDVRGATGDFQVFCMDFSSPKDFRILEDLDAAQLRTDLVHEMGQDNLDTLYNEAIDEIEAHLENYKV